VQRATAQSKTGFFRDYGVAEAPPGFQAGWSDCMYFSLFLFISFAHLEIMQGCNVVIGYRGYFLGFMTFPKELSRVAYVQLT
jgi:hypothetical protein